MNLYDRYILPKIVGGTCKQKPNMRQREKVILLAIGKVLEIGIGSGLNLPIYNKENVNHLTGIDPSKEMWDENIVDTQNLPFDFEFIKAFAEDVPADSNSFDTVVTTYTLCTIPDTNKALDEIQRILKQNGQR